MPIDGFEAGLKVRREVLGDEYVDRAFEGVTDFDREFARRLRGWQLNVQD